MIIEVSGSIIALKVWNLEVLREWCLHDLVIDWRLVAKPIVRYWEEIMNHLNSLVQFLKFSHNSQSAEASDRLWDQ